MGFFGMFVAKKVDEAIEDFAEALVKFDPETASEAQLAQLEENLGKVSTQCAEARQEYNREQKEANDIEALFNKRMSAAEILQTKLTGADDSAKASIEASLTKLLTDLEEMGPELEREKQEAVEAKEILDELESYTKEAAETLKGARSSLTKARRDMEKAGLQAERAKQKEERVKSMAGLKKKGTGLNTALGAMQKAANDSKATADAASMRAKLLKPVEVSEDANIAAALAEASGETKPVSVADRLAALKK